MAITLPMHHARYIVFAVVLAAAASEMNAQQPAQPGTRRFVADSFWVRQWMRGGTKEPDLLTQPRAVVSSAGIAAVLDQGTREVFVFDLATGKSRVTMAARGAGPGEFQRPARIAATPTGFVLLDHGTSRLTAFGGSGSAEWDTPLKSAYGNEGMCVRSNLEILLKTEGAVNALLMLDTAGKTLGRLSLDASASPQAGLEWAGEVAGPDARGNCIVARRYGSEWFVVSPTGDIRRYPYVVRSRAPRVDTKEKVTGTVNVSPKLRQEVRERLHKIETDPSIYDAMVRADTLIVRTDGPGRDDLMLLDYYHIPTGRYLRSRRLPGLTNAVTIGADGQFLAIIIGDESSALYALRTSNQPASKSKPKTP